MLSVGPAGEPVTGRPPPSGERTVLIEIPPDIERVRKVDAAQALAWRYELRAALALMIPDKSWHVTGFARSGWYLLERR
jgi:predicted GNAT superfamily acetyltransferase